MTMNLFELATRKKFLFPCSRGNITVQDLWDLPLRSTVDKPNLDDVARNLFRQLRNDDGVSFVNEGTTVDSTIEKKLDVVKYIIEVKKTEKLKTEEHKAKAAEHQLLLEALANLDNEDRKKMTREEIKAKIAAFAA
jgi:hypothetical protein